MTGLKVHSDVLSATRNDKALRTCVRVLLNAAIIAAFSSGYTISDMSQSSDLIQSAQRTIRLEMEAVQGLLPQIDADFVRACEMILASKGRVVVVGMGKSGHVG
ncbi:MAG: hypothetical protein M3Q94_09655, partial [Pseudomonadota bacterium]|nr:hypothetical protein [Pseudomonadota bacterium]